MQTISKMDWDIINARVSTAVDISKLPTKSIGLLAVVIEQLFPSIQDRLQEAVTDGSNDRGIDAIHIIENEASAEIYIFQSKYRETHKSCSRTINDADILKVSLFLNELFDKADALANCDNFRLGELVQRIWELHEIGKICRYHVVYCSNGNGFSHSAKDIIKTTVEKYSQVTFEFYGGNEIISGMASEGRKNEDGCLKVVGKEILERSDGDVRGVIASIDAMSFIDLIKTQDGQTIKRHLFDDNLRVFLGVKGGYNPDIIETATSSDSYLFWYLNNGITITCKNFSYNKGHVGPTLRFEDFQIVNGAQTSHSLMMAYRANPESFEDVVLMVRIYATDRADIAERVAVATNSQARIQSRDLRSNHTILKKMELALKEKGFFFERKKSMHSDKPVDKRIDALKLGQIIQSYELREPDRAKTESDAIFGSRFTSIFHDRHNIDEIVNLYKLYGLIEKKRDVFSAEHGNARETDHPYRYLVYGHWVILFTCKLLQIKNKSERVPTDQEADTLVEEAIRLVAAACSQNKAVAHYQMFRSPRTKDKILNEIGAKQLDFYEIWAA